MDTTRLRGRALAAVGTMLLAAVALPAGASAVDRTASYDLGGTGIVPVTATTASDGALWASAAGGGTVRVADDGSLRRFADAPGWREHLIALRGGDVAAVVAGTRGKEVVTLRRGGRRSVRRLPFATRAATVAVQPDGTVWYARSCDDRLVRVAVGGRLHRVRLPRLGCRFVDEWETPQASETIVRGADGATWLANRCQGRVVRVDRRDRVLVRRLPSACSEDVSGNVQPTRALAERSGALRLDGYRIGARGVVRRVPGLTVPTLAVGGAEYTATAGEREVAVRTPAGVPTTATTAEPLHTLFASGDGRAAFTSGAWQKPRPYQLWSPLPTTLGAISANGTVVQRTLPEWPGVVYTAGLAAPGRDGFVWVVQRGNLAGQPDAGAVRAVRLDLNATAVASDHEETR